MPAAPSRPVRRWITSPFFARPSSALKAERRYRVFADIERLAGRFPAAIWHHPDGAARDRRLVLERLSRHGPAPGRGGGHGRDGAARPAPAPAAPATSPATAIRWSMLEAELADLHGKEAALVFTSGYVSNQAGIATIARLIPDCLILSDALNHNSMIEGVRQSGRDKAVFRHNDLAHLEELLVRAGRERPKLIVFESVYSMDGDVAPIRRICDLAERHGAMTYLDEVHAVGMYGAARRRRRRARRRHAPDRRHRGHARQGLRRDGRLYRGRARRSSTRCAATRRASSSPPPCRRPWRRPPSPRCGTSRARRRSERAPGAPGREDQGGACGGRACRCSPPTPTSCR